MTSKERILAAMRCKEVDYVPMVIEWNEDHKHEKLTWTNTRQMLEVHRDKGWDTHLSITAEVTPAAAVKIETGYENDAEGQVLCQTWNTPAGPITEKLRVTEDWYELKDGRPYLQFMSDFRTSRYIEAPFKNEKDLKALEYLFPVDNPTDTQSIIKAYNEKRKLADEFQVPLFVYFDPGMDWLLWLFRPEDAVINVVEEPEFVLKLLAQINKAKHERLKLLLDLGVDGIIRRGWYESADLWSPAIFRKFARPAIEKEIEMTHNAGKPYTYLMMTGIMPMLDELASLKFDCLLGLEPALGGQQDMKKIHDALPGKALWGGFSGPMHFGAESPDAAEKAVYDAISTFGRKGLILGTGASYRYYWPWENFEAAERAWRKLR